MSKKAMPVQADQGKIIQFSDFKSRRIFSNEKKCLGMAKFFKDKDEAVNTIKLLMKLESLSLVQYYKTVGTIQGRIATAEGRD